MENEEKIKETKKKRVGDTEKGRERERKLEKENVDRRDKDREKMRVRE